MIKKSVVLIALLVIYFMPTAGQDLNRSQSGWQVPPEEIMKVLHAPELPLVWTAPTGEYMFLAEPLQYPTLAEMGAPMHKLAGMRVNPATNGFHGRNWGGTSPYVIRIEDGVRTALDLPAGAEVFEVAWNVDGRRFALTVEFPDGFELWVGSVDGKIRKIENVLLNPLMANPVTWLPDQERLLVWRIPERGPAPIAPVIPAGPEIRQGKGATARSTY